MLYLYVNVIIVNEMCMGHVKMRLGRVNMASECDREQNCIFDVYNDVA